MKLRTYFKAIALPVVLLLCSCSSNTVVANNNIDKLSVVATIFPQYDFAREIAGDNADIKLLLSPGGDSHSYEPTTADIMAVKNCDIFICVGGESDIWSQGILDSIDMTGKKVIKLMDCVETVEEEITEGMQVEEHEHDEAEDDFGEIEYDEHVWTSPLNAIKISQKIAGEMQDLDSENAKIYEENLADYVARLTELDEKFHQAVAKSANKPIVFGDRFPFRYLADELGISYYAAFPGCSTDSDASAATLAKLIGIVRDNDINIVYHIEYSTEKIAAAIAAETGAKTLLLHSCHTISQEEMDSGASYISIMSENLTRLEEGLN